MKNKKGRNEKVRNRDKEKEKEKFIEVTSSLL